MKRIIAVSMLFFVTVLNANIWNTPDYNQPQEVVVVEPRPATQTVVVEKEYVTRGGYYSGRPVRTAVEGAVDTADTAVESAANVVRSIFN